MNIDELVVPYRELYKSFKMDKYKNVFFEYQEATFNIVNEISLSNNLEKITDELIEAIKNASIENKKASFFKRKEYFENYRLTILFFTIPMLNESRKENINEFMNIFVSKWNKEFKTKLNITTFDRLNNGFEKETILGSMFPNLFKK